MDDSLGTFVQWFSGTLDRGSQGFAPRESVRLGLTPDLQGREIDLVRMIINQNVIQNVTRGVQSTFDVTWQIQGIDPARVPPAPVPEPSTLALLVTGIAGLLSSERRRRAR